MKTHLPALALLLGLTGCRSSLVEKRGPPPPDPMQELHGDLQIESDLETLDIRMSESGRGRLLELDLRNKSASELRFAWAIEWYDREGKLVAGSERAWTPMTLEASAARSIQVPMPSPDATSWRLRAVRPGSNTSSQGDSR